MDENDVNTWMKKWNIYIYKVFFLLQICQQNYITLFCSLSHSLALFLLKSHIDRSIERMKEQNKVNVMTLLLLRLLSNKKNKLFQSSVTWKKKKRKKKFQLEIKSMLYLLVFFVWKSDMSVCIYDRCIYKRMEKRENKRSTNSSLEDTTYTTMCAIWDVVEKKRRRKSRRGGGRWVKDKNQSSNIQSF